MNSPFNVAHGNEQAHAELVERLQQIRDRRVSDDMLILEAADILTDAQAPLLDIIDGLERDVLAGIAREFENLAKEVTNA